MDPLGLTSQEAQVRLRSIGSNSFATESQRSWPRLIAAVLREPMLILLIATGTINFLLAELADALLLMVTVLIVLAISIVQERRSERAIPALSDLTAPLALVIRDGVERRVPSTQVVPGDLLLLLEGDRIVADAQIDSAAVLAIDESLLTGESIPVDKAAGDNVFAGSLVLRGHGRATVTATGSASELGKIGKSIQTIPYERSRLQGDIDRLVKVVGALVALADQTVDSENLRLYTQLTLVIAFAVSWLVLANLQTVNMSFGHLMSSVAFLASSQYAFSQKFENLSYAIAFGFVLLAIWLYSQTPSLVLIGAALVTMALSLTEWVVSGMANSMAPITAMLVIGGLMTFISASAVRARRQ